MRIFQHTATLTLNDAVSDNLIAIDKLLKENGFETKIYAERIDKKYHDIAEQDNKLSPKDEDITLFHVSIAAEIYDNFDKYRGKKIIVYHNITPPQYLVEYSPIVYEAAKRGREQLKKIINEFDGALADSQYNGEELVNEFKYNKIFTVLPIIYDFEKLQTNNNHKLANKLKGHTNFIFVGRIAPNKYQQDLVKAFYFYHKYVDPKSQLHIIGSYEGMESYKRAIDKLIIKLKLVDNVFLPGKVSEQDKHTYFRNSNLYISMSEHEGFCVPVVECMYFELPVLAYFNSGALPDTLGKGGIYFTKKEFFEIALLMDKLVKDTQLRKKLINNQKEEIVKFQKERVKEILFDFINNYK